MATETQTQQTEPTGTPTVAGVAATPPSEGVESKDDGKEALRRALAKQADDFNARMEKIQAENEQFKKAQEESARAKLEEEGKFKELAQQAEDRAKKLQAQMNELQEQAEAEKKRLEADHTKKLKIADLKTALVNAGAKNEVVLAGLMSMVPDEFEVLDYVKKSQQDHPESFKTSPVQGTPPQSGRPGGSPSTEWEQVKKDYENLDPKVRFPAIRKYELYCKENNEEPPGWKG